MTSVSSRIGLSPLRRRCAALLPVFGLLVLSPVIAAAQNNEAELRTAARDLASQGIEAFDRHDYVAALDRFQRAFALVPAPSISVMQARALAQLGRILEALDVYEKTQRMPLPPDAPEAFKQAVLDAQRESEALWRDIPRLTIHVKTTTPAPSDLTIMLDSKKVPPALLDVSRPADPGPHQITARASGFAAETRTIMLERGSKATVEIPLVATVDSGQGGEKPPSHDEVTSDGSSKRLWGWAAVGAGSAGLVLSGITGVIALQKHSALESECHPGCPAGAESDLSMFHTTRTLSYASFLAGSVSLGVGSYLLLSGSGNSPTVGASVGPAQVALWGRF